jgi:hypothetical protein
MALAVTMQERTRQNAANARMLRQFPLILAWSLLDNCGQSVSLPSVTGDILASGLDGEPQLTRDGTVELRFMLADSTAPTMYLRPDHAG